MNPSFNSNAVKFIMKNKGKKQAQQEEPKPNLVYKNGGGGDGENKVMGMFNNSPEASPGRLFDKGGNVKTHSPQLENSKEEMNNTNPQLMNTMRSNGADSVSSFKNKRRSKNDIRNLLSSELSSQVNLKNFNTLPSKDSQSEEPRLESKQVPKQQAKHPEKKELPKEYPKSVTKQMDYVKNKMSNFVVDMQQKIQE